MDENINTRFRLWIDKENKPYLGLGRVILLEKIQEFGSITRGAAAIEMSYRKAWQLVENMNKLSKEPLVEKRLGGKTGGGAHVTKAGEKAIRRFYNLQEEIEQFIKSKTKEIDL